MVQGYLHRIFRTQYMYMYVLSFIVIQNRVTTDLCEQYTGRGDTPGTLLCKTLHSKINRFLWFDFWLRQLSNFHLSLLHLIRCRQSEPWILVMAMMPISLSGKTNHVAKLRKNGTYCHACIFHLQLKSMIYIILTSYNFPDNCLCLRIFADKVYV